MMKREINDDYLYLVLTPMEYSHIKTVLAVAIDDVDDATKHELIYVYDALTDGYCNFLTAAEFKDIEGGEEDEDEQ